MDRWIIEEREVDALYRLTPEDFVTARDSLARVLRAGGDRELAATVTALRRPSVGAWLVNQLVREHPADIAELVAAGAAMRETQAGVLTGDADGAQLQALAAERRVLIDALVQQARDLASRAERRSAPLDAVHATLVAASADAAAAVAVTSGRLVRELSYSGFGLTDDVADSFVPPLQVAPRKPAKPAAPRPAITVEPATSREREAAPAKVGHKAAAKQAATVPTEDPRGRARLAAAAASAAAVSDAQTAVQDALGAADDAQRGYDALTAELERCEAEHLRLIREQAAAHQQLTTLKDAQRAARATAKAAHVAAEKARTALVRAQQKRDNQR